MQPMIRCYVAVQTWRWQLWNAMSSDEAGEGVMSTAIAVLIMAFLGAMMWVAFKSLFKTASGNTSKTVASIGS